MLRTIVCIHSFLGLIGSPIDRAPIIRMFTVRDPPQPLKNLLILIIMEAFWVNQSLLDMLSTFVSNSHFEKRPTARGMTTFVSHVGTQRVNSY